MAYKYLAGRGGGAGGPRKKAGTAGGARGGSCRGADGPGRAPERATSSIRVRVVNDDQVDRIAPRRARVRAADVHPSRGADAVLPAIGLLAARPCDGVFLDYTLPGGDGPTFLRGVRAAGIAVPVTLTGQQDGRVARRPAQAGAAGYIDKPDAPPARLLQAPRQAIPAMRGIFNAHRGLNP